MSEGAPVPYVESTTQAAVAAADDVVEKLIDEGWEPGRIPAAHHSHSSSRAVGRDRVLRSVERISAKG